MRLKSIAFALLISSLCCLLSQAGKAQGHDTRSESGKTVAEDDDDLMKMLEAGTPAPKVEYTSATFKTTRLINGHSIENVAKGVLDFKISHRFTNLNKGIQDFFGLDGANIRLGLDYGLSDKFMIGIGRNSFEKEYDGFIKGKLLRQHRGVPLSISYMGAASIQTMEANVLPWQTYHLSNRVYYVNQLLLARKFSKQLSLQLMPTHVHYNLVNTKAEPNDILALGIGGRLKLSQRISLNVEYYYQLPGYRLDGTTNSLAIGFDIETGGHVFQLHFTNSTGMTERTFVANTTEQWGDGGIRFGFNISRVFTVVRPKEFKNSRNKIY
ncbi:MAG: DUF5777 family beta-barrel protein [Bacteroidota bacterium]